MNDFNKGLKNGKLPLSDKEKPKWNIEDFTPFGNALKVPPALKAHGESIGIEFRWVSANTLHSNYGYHPRGWKPFKMDDPKLFGIEDYKLGRDPDGYLRRGMMMLAFKPKEAGDAQRLHLKEKADRQLGYPKKKADDMKKDFGSVMKIHEGYEENS